MPYHDEYTSTHIVRTYTPSNAGQGTMTITMMRLPNGNYAPEEGWEDTKIRVLAEHLGLSGDFDPIDVTVKYAEKS